MKNLLLLLLISVSITAVNATTIFVQNTNDTGIGSLRQATIDAFDGDTIRFNSSIIASGSDTIKLTSQISFNKSLVFKGLYNANDSLFISGENSYRIFNINLSPSPLKKMILDSLILINGNAGSGHGGAVFCNNAINFEINYSIIKHNKAYRSAGVHFSGYGNSPRFISTNSMFIENTSVLSTGGLGIYSNSPSLNVSIANSTVALNSAGEHSGGITIENYSAVNFLNLNITNSTIALNNAAWYGGGLSIHSDILNADIISSTIFGNIANTSGGGIYDFANTSILSIESSIIANNDGIQNIYRHNPNIISSGYNIFGDLTILGSVDSDYLGVSDIQLNLSLLKNNGGTTFTLAPLCGSIAINNGSTDINNAQNIPIMGTRDIGAAEYISIPDTWSLVYDCDSISFNGQTYFTDTLLSTTFPSSLGCDSIVYTQIQINNSTLVNTNTVVYCDSGFVNGNWYYASQIITDSLSSLLTGCDSIVNTTIIVNQSVILSNPTITACDSIEYRGNIYYKDTTITTLSLGGAVNGCNLTTIQQLVVINIDVSTNLNEFTITANQANLKYQWIDCNNNNAAIVGENNQSFTPSINGDYAVIITNDFCSDTSTCVPIKSLSVADLSASNIKVYPNPTTGTFTIDFGNNKNNGSTIQILNAIGKTIKQLQINNQSVLIDISNYENGIYFVKIDQTITRIVKY